MLGRGLNFWSMVSVSGTLLGLALTVSSVQAADRIDPEADKILRSMSTYLGGTTVIIEGATLHHCGSTYYQPHNKQYVVVYVD